jgi:GGDEF domain-containing protein
VNDTYGHQMGDQALKHFADKMRCYLRPADPISRIGGDEFMIILPDTGLADALSALSKVRQGITHEGVTVELTGVKYSVSAGVAELRDEDTSKNSCSASIRLCMLQSAADVAGIWFRTSNKTCTSLKAKWTVHSAWTNFCNRPKAVLGIHISVQSFVWQLR